VYALYLAYRDPRVPWYARAWALLVVAYALSPIDLIPDALPVIGYLDDLVLVPLGLMLAHRLIPPAVMAEARVRAAAGLPVGTARTARIGGLIVVLLWLGLAALAIYLLLLRAPAA
jgi:uncharacterized membrane protein YkvA (DUF1232 family)